MCEHFGALNVSGPEFNIARLSPRLASKVCGRSPYCSVAIFRSFRYHYRHDVSTRKPIVGTMTLRLLMLIVFVEISSSAASAGPTIKIKVEDCMGLKGEILADSVFGCKVTVEPQDVKVTIFATSGVIQPALPQEIQGHGALGFQVTAKAAPGRHEIGLFASRAGGSTLDAATEVQITIAGDSAPKSESAAPVVGGKRSADRLGEFMEDKRRYLSAP